MGPEVTVLDLTGDHPASVPVVGMVTRFPPSESGSAPAAEELSTRLRSEYGLAVDVVRLMTPGEEPASGHPVIMDLDAGWHLAADHAARRLSHCDVVIVQVDRRVPLDLIEMILRKTEAPTIVSLQYVGPAGSAENRRLGRVAMLADVIVVPSGTARNRLEEETPRRIEVIPYGSPWDVVEPRREPRDTIITWGFITPDLGVERVLRALALLADVEPAPRYRLVGVADPSWSRRDVTDYRDHIVRQAEELGLGRQFEMVPVLHDRHGLRSEIEESDLIAVVYDSKDKACSRILSEAVSTGRPVVATRFPGAVELLAAGAGSTVSHDDDHEMAAALRTYLTDDDAYRRASAAAAALSPSLSWDFVARRFAELVTTRLGLRAALADTRW